MKNRILILFYVLIAFSLNEQLHAQVINTITKIGKDIGYKDWYKKSGGVTSRANDITNDSSGNIYYSTNSTIVKIDRNSGIHTIIAGQLNHGFGGDGGLAINALLNNPTGIVIDKKNDIIFVDALNYRIRKVNQISGIIQTIAGKGEENYLGDGGLAINAYIGYCYGITIDTQNNILISDFSFHRIRKINTGTGIISTFAGNGLGSASATAVPALSAYFSHPTDIALSKNGDVYVADMDNHRIRKIDAANKMVTIYAGSGLLLYGNGVTATSARLNQPCSICFDDSDNLYITDYAHTLRKVNYSDKKIFLIAGKNEIVGFEGDRQYASLSLLNWPNGLILDPISKSIIINDALNSCLREVSYCPLPPEVNKNAIHCQLDKTKKLNATGTNLKWYDRPWGGIPSTLDLIPNTDLVDTISYFVSQTIAGKESARNAIVVEVCKNDTVYSINDYVEHCYDDIINNLSRNIGITGNLEYFGLFSDPSLKDTIQQPGESLLNPSIRKYYFYGVNFYGCKTNVDSFEVGFRDFPPVPTYDIPIDLCQGTKIEELKVTGERLKWYESEKGGRYTEKTPSPQNIVLGTTYYYVSQTNSTGCESQIGKVQVNINPMPFQPSIVSPVIYCQQDSALPLIAYPGKLNWFNSDTSIIGEKAPVPPTSNEGSFSYLVRSINEYKCGSYLRKIDVTVKHKPLISTEEKIIAPVTGKPITITAESDNGAQFNWSSGNKGSEITFTPNNEGQHIHWVYSTALNGCKSDTIWHHIDILPSEYWNSQFEIHPNPFKSHLAITNINLKDVMSVQLYMLNGIKVFQSEIPLKSLEVNLPENLSSGYYILEVSTVGHAHPSMLLFKE